MFFRACKAFCRRSKRSNPSQLFKASAKEATASSCNAFAEISKRRKWKQRSSKAAARLRAPDDVETKGDNTRALVISIFYYVESFIKQQIMLKQSKTMKSFKICCNIALTTFNIQCSLQL